MTRIARTKTRIERFGDEKNCIGGTFLGLNRSLDPHLCHFQLQSRAVEKSGNFSYEVNLIIWEIPIADSASVRARYALNLAYFIYLCLFSRFFYFSP